MHLDNLAPLLRLWPLFVVLAAGLLAFYLYESGRRAREWLTRTKAPRLTYQGPPIDDPSRRPKARRRK
jgi:hypothetical protein